MNFENSETMYNLMRSFAGESQARNRYNISAKQARSEELYAVGKLFDLTATQEQAHGTVFYNLLKDINLKNFDFTASYPINVFSSTIEYVRAAKANEEDEFKKIYGYFAEIAKKEGFDNISATFNMIAKIEDIHSKRFEKLENDMSNNSLFMKDTDTKWICTNCGFTFEGKGAPVVCPVCAAKQGYFLEKSYFTIL